MVQQENKQDVHAQTASADSGSTPLSPLSLPKGGGAIRGIGEKFAANPVTGTGSMTVPIATSPGRSGFDPQLSLSYDSGAGNGPFGFGWTLSLPAITRKTDKGLPQYRDAEEEESDVYVLSGAEDLVPFLLPDGKRFKDDTTSPEYTIHRYRPRIEGLFARIERWTNIATGEIHWRSITRDNVTTLYGKGNNSRIFDPADPMPAHPTHVFSWLICASYDDKGNAIVYEYEAEDDNVDRAQANERNRVRTANRYLKRITYGNRTPNRDATTWQATDLAQFLNDTWMFDVVFDYGEGHYAEDAPDAQGRIFAQAQIDPLAGSHKPVRQDPFSTYRAGFEVRTYRLCHRVLMFHHFPQELGINDCLIRSTEFSYAESPIASFISGITQSGYVHQPIQNQPQRYLKQSLPPLEFEYSRVPTPEELAQQPIREVDAERLENLPVGLEGASYQWMDLDGEGISGILTEQADAWYYKRNLSANNLELKDGHQHTIARFGATEVVARKPAVGLAGGGQFLDLAGDGQVDLVQMEGFVRGFYERTDDANWSPFQPFASWPNLSTRDPDMRFVDLTGDGHADILITEGEALTWYPSLAETGFGQAVRVSLPLDEEKGPRLVFSDGVQSIYLADLSGDGLSDLVRIRNGEVCYWPNLGYGRFGAKVTMDNAPWFDAPDQFDQRRIRLADTDGSGTTDMLYLRRDGVQIYFNQSGNRWNDAVALLQFPPIDTISSIQVLDLLGNGTACLVWSSPLPGATRRPMRYLVLMEEKPHMLVRVKNNLGAETSAHYAPSTRFYLDDKGEGRPWITRLPFPVHVVERVETYDRISRNRFVTRYAYHHGYFDGVEREFRGFGMVEQWDTEEIGTVAPGITTTEDTNWDAVSFVPPVLTRTWFHTGASIEGGRISKQFEHEYYREGDASRGEAGLTDQQLEAMLLDDTVLPVTIRLFDGTRIPYVLSGEESREACRSLKGAILRQEIYGLDKNLDGTPTEESDRPYSVSERNYTIELLQPQGQNRHIVFFTHARETVDFHYERKLFDIGSNQCADPRVTHALTLEVDNYGNVLQSVAIGYGRRFQDLSLPTDDQKKQANALATYMENIYTKTVLEADAYRTPMLCESRTYEVLNLTFDPKEPLPAITNLFRFDQVSKQIKQAGDGIHDLPYEDSNHSQATTSDPYRRLIEHVRTLYRKNDLTGFSPPGIVESLALSGESYKLAFTPNLLKTIYVDTGKVSTNDVNTVFGTDGAYVHSEGDANWWIPSGRVFYSPTTNDLPASELAFAQSHFFLPHRYRDPFHTDQLKTEATVAYDQDPAGQPYNLLVVVTRDALGNEVRAVHDYRLLQPWRITDPNGNRSEVAFDTLGMIVGTVVMGKATESRGDLLDDTFIPDLDDATILAHIANPLANDPHDILQKATTRLVYDLFAYQRTKDIAQPHPAVVYTLARDTHHFDLGQNQQTKIQHSFSYSDGFGREIQKKIQAEPLVKGGPPRWVGSGWTIFNNKGKPVRQYEPFFSSTHEFEFSKQVGVSPVLFYDPVERVIATLHPNRSYEKVVFDPWHQVTWDVNDTVLLDPRTDPDIESYVAHYFKSEPVGWQTWHTEHSGSAEPAEQRAAQKAIAHASTPTIAWFDTLGRPFLTIADNGTNQKYRTLVTLDIEGNQRIVTDARGNDVMARDFDMLGTPAHTISTDAGARWMLNNVAGKPIRGWDSRGYTRSMIYDVLHRPTELYVSSDSQSRVLAEKTEYGESIANPEQTNHRGKVYKAFDGAGVITNESYDFKGNLLGATRKVLENYKDLVNWAQNPPPVVEHETFTSHTRYDAMNRSIQVVAPHSDKAGTKFNIIQPGYNEANLLETVDAWLSQDTEPASGDALLLPETTSFHPVTNIDYDAKGQRTSITYGNGVTTTYDYDQLTFRLMNLHTIRPTGLNGLDNQLFKVPTVVQDLHYTYDPMGNITEIRDDALPTLFFNGQQIEPISIYLYDALYRLTKAEGREHAGQNTYHPQTDVPRNTYRDYPFVNEPNANDVQAMRNYTEQYEYDSVGNILKMDHQAGPTQSWICRYEYDATNNRLRSTSLPGDAEDAPYSAKYGYDEHGNMKKMPHLDTMKWDFKDQLSLIENGTEKAYYVYDSAGQRVRKVVEKNNGSLIEERIYLGGYEIFRQSNGSGLKLERETLHVMDDKQRIALVETKTVDIAVPPFTPKPLIRFQFGNHLGSASVELDKDGALISYEEYHPYGTTAFQAGRSIAEVSLKRYRYIGKERDEESGFFYHGARYYTSWLGRWISCDPVMNTNLFLYANNNPVVLMDPNGRAPEVSPLDSFRALLRYDTSEIADPSKQSEAAKSRLQLEANNQEANEQKAVDEAEVKSSQGHTLSERVQTFLQKDLSFGLAARESQYEQRALKYLANIPIGRKASKLMETAAEIDPSLAETTGNVGRESLSNFLGGIPATEQRRGATTWASAPEIGKGSGELGYEGGKTVLSVAAIALTPELELELNVRTSVTAKTVKLIEAERGLYQKSLQKIIDTEGAAGLKSRAVEAKKYRNFLEDLSKEARKNLGSAGHGKAHPHRPGMIIGSDALAINEKGKPLDSRVNSIFGPNERKWAEQIKKMPDNVTTVKIKINIIKRR